MRSSIACSRCRRSKIKCVNAGIDTTCRACESSGRECAYPAPAMGAGGAAAKRDLNAVADGDDRNGDWDSPKRQRSRKSMAASVAVVGKDSKANGLALDTSLLTVKVWESLFDLFQRHFSTTLPFLHPTTFLSQIRQLSSLSPNATVHADGQPAKENSQSPAPTTGASPLILLGILTLTARFHPQLVQHHSPSSSMSPSNPLAASEFYANALRARLTGPDGADFASVDINRVQALLMLGLHEWGMCRGKNAWVYTGMAIRMAQAMGLGLESEDDASSSPRPSISTAANSGHRDHKDQSSDDVIEQETKRRTFWSCFMLDRCLSGGKYRPRTIRVRDMGIQLPSDNAFAFGERVRTSRLSEGSGDRRRSQGYDARSSMPISSLRQSVGFSDDAKLRASGTATADSKHWSSSSHRSDGAENGIDRWEVGAEECVLGRLVRIVRVWGSIVKWSSAGGRKVDQYPPWHPDSRFSHLRELLIDFQEGLSRNLRYSTRNTDTHIMYKNTLAAYSLMHIIYFLSVIVLHRAYLPFLPLRYFEPLGPSDEPSFPPEKYNTPDGFWRDSAREVFKASRQMTELVRICHDRGVLVETPLVGFAIYNAAFMGVYAVHFNHMDQEGYSCSKPNSTDIIPGLGGQGQADVRKAVEILGEMRLRLKMAVGWFRTIHRLHSYFSRAKRDYKSTSRKPENDIGMNGMDQLSSPGFSGSQDELKRLDKILTDLGITEDQIPEVNGSDDDAAIAPSNTIEHGTTSDTASNAVKSESGNELDSHLDGAGLRRESWVPVNSPGHQNLLPPAGKEGGEHGRHDSASTHRPIENDRWPNLPPPQPNSYTLPAIQPPPQGRPSSSNASPNLPPPQSISPGSYGSSVSSSLHPFLSAPSSSNRLQPLQPWPNSRQPHPPPYSQSLPPINPAAQHAFSMPTLPPASSLSHHHLTPPPRVESTPRPLPVDHLGTNNANLAWMASLGGDDIIAFVSGDSYDQLSSQPAVPSGWLTAVWGQYGQA